MKLKQATLLAIIGVIVLLIPPLMDIFAQLGFLSYFNYSSNPPYQHWYFQYLSILRFIGTALLLPYFIILFKKQK